MVEKIRTMRLMINRLVVRIFKLAVLVRLIWQDAFLSSAAKQFRDEHRSQHTGGHYQYSLHGVDIVGLRVFTMSRGRTP